MSDGAAVGLVDRVGRSVRGWLRGLVLAYVPQVVNRFPPIRVAIGPSVPGWMLRLVVAGLALALVSVIHPMGYLWWLIGLVLAAMIIAPGRLLPPITAAGLGILMVLTGTPPSILQTALLVLGLPAMAMLGALAGTVGPLARIELAALLPSGRRLLGIQLIAQPVALLGALLSGAPLSLSVLPVLAVLGLGVLVLVWAPTLGDREHY